MGLLVSQFLTRLFSRKQIRILMVGLDGAGKTTILYKLKLGDVVTTIPTIGFNVESVEYNNITFTVWDVGGQDKIRRLWRYYYHNTDGIIYVVDSSDRDRIQSAGEELRNILCERELQDAVILILANKQDLPTAMNLSEVADNLQLSLIKNRKWHLQATCALRGDGLCQGIDWLSEELSKK